MNSLCKLGIALACLLPASATLAAGKAEHIVIMVWDGMRPDFVTPEHTPNLWKLSQEGVTFTHHHPVYLSSTEVNGTALATGMYPEKSGVIGNKEYRPQIDRLKVIQTETVPAVRKGDELTGGHYLATPTIAETLHRHGMRTVVAGAKGVALLQDRAARPDSSPDVVLFEGKTLPQSVTNELVGAEGAFPPVSLPKLGRDRWTTEAVVKDLWQKGVPPFSLIWLSEPDYSQHETGPGSPTALKAIKSSDDNLGRVLSALAEKHILDKTDIIIVSDHGFSTIWRNVDLVGALNANGFHAFKEFREPGPKAGDILVVGNGGTACIYVTGHDEAVITRLAHFLQSQDYAGVLFSAKPLDGTFPLEAALIDSATAPDLALSLHWSAEQSTNGTPGLICSVYSQYGPGQGMHGSLSRFDLHNTCIAVGPDFRRGFRDEVPSGNVDVAPTVLWLLGVEPAQKLSGRVLAEALVNSPTPAPSVKHQHIEANYQGDGFIWRQHLDFSEVEGTKYLDEGDGEVKPLAR